MRKTAKLLDGATAATSIATGAYAICAACCIVPPIGAVFAGLGIASIGTLALGWMGATLALAGLAIVGAIVWQRNKTKKCSSEQWTSTAPAPIVCTLESGDLKERMIWIQNVARAHLRSWQRENLSLRLVYAPAATAELRDIVKKERTCCPFLSFDLQEGNFETALTITAPAEAREAADTLFSPFFPALENPRSPDSLRQIGLCGCSPKGTMNMGVS